MTVANQGFQTTQGTFSPGPELETSPIPPLGAADIASIPKDKMISVKTRSEFIWDQYQSGLARRRPHAVSWIQIQSILKGIHYFEIDSSGNWYPIDRLPGEIRAIVPILAPRYRHALGFFNSNTLGVSTIPIAGSDKPIYAADRAYRMLTHWIDEVQLPLMFDRANQILLTEGLVGLHRYIDPFRQNAFVRALPGSELFPIPFDAKHEGELHGLIHATMVTKQWLEQQDRLLEQATGSAPQRRMADKATSKSLQMRLDLPQVGSSAGRGGKFDGALVLNVWFKGNPEIRSGEYYFLVEDEAFRHSVGESASFVMPKGELPVELVWQDKNPHEFWGHGLCESWLPAQFSANRNMTVLEKNARYNRAYTFVDTDVVSWNDMQSEEDALIPIRGDRLSNPNQRPAFHFPPSAMNVESGGLVNMAMSIADQAGGMRSGLLFGQAEGRVESGVATNQLSQNAMASFQNVLRRWEMALKKTYPEILDMLAKVWPAGKKIRVAGPGNVGREIQMQQDQMPRSEQVIIEPRPLLPGGTQTLANILFQLRQIPGPDGKPGTELNSGEFRNSLRELNLLPPGIDTSNKAEARLQTRINMLINDGQKPAVRPADIRQPGERQIMEDHRVAVEMLKDVILDETFEMYGPPVQQALMTEIQYHINQTHGATEHPNNVDDDLDKVDSQFTEDFLAAAEQDFFTDEGDYLSGV